MCLVSHAKIHLLSRFQFSDLDNLVEMWTLRWPSLWFNVIIIKKRWWTKLTEWTLWKTIGCSFSEGSAIAEYTWLLHCLVLFQSDIRVITDFFFLINATLFFAIEWLAQPPGVLAIKQLDSKTRRLFLYLHWLKISTASDNWGASESDRKNLKWQKHSISCTRTVKKKLLGSLAINPL